MPVKEYLNFNWFLETVLTLPFVVLFTCGISKQIELTDFSKNGELTHTIILLEKVAIVLILYSSFSCNDVSKVLQKINRIDILNETNLEIEFEPRRRHYHGEQECETSCKVSENLSKHKYQYQVFMQTLFLDNRTSRRYLSAKKNHSLQL